MRSTTADVVYEQARQKLAGWLRSQLIGPTVDDDLLKSPLQRYPTGVLYPIEPNESGTDPATAGLPDTDEALLDEDEAPASLTGEETEDRANAQPPRRRRYVPPSSVGFSFFVRDETRLSITTSAAVYKATEHRDAGGQYQATRYRRTQLAEQTQSWSAAEPSVPRIWEGRAGIDVRWRPYRDGAILTVTLVNRGKLSSNAAPGRKQAERVEKSLFEANLECVVEQGELVEYPRVDPSLLTEEEQELELQYRDRDIYAVGHGAAVAWVTRADAAPRISVEFMPCEEVPVTANAGGEDEVLGLEYLAEANRSDALEAFVKGYANWIDGQQLEAASLANTSDQAAAERMCRKMTQALSRMRASVELLRDNPLVAESFRLANQAMLEQMRRADGPESQESKPPSWRPFQLAFLLTVMRSTALEEDEFRDVLDLIWFPTGGGKTEAYLGLIAFLIVWRRLKYQDTGGGTAAFMRYTLRLLTRQQFERAARLICALELIRRDAPGRLGEEPITVGMWVGRDVSPNWFRDAMRCVQEIAGGSTTARNKLVLENCPWCGTLFDAGASYRATLHNFHFHCVNAECEFGRDQSPLPCNVVDEALYENPPSLLIATIDKFARVAWEPRSGAFFGKGSTLSRPPEVVIQDELHLITGPLGSVAGLYEAGFDTLLVRSGVRPKYIASTATIRMASEQVRRLYARSLAVFPPPGLSCDDSYFAVTDCSRPGRLFVGYLAPLLDQQHCFAPLAAALLAAPLTVFDDDADEADLVDAWWTQIVYHGSLRGVGNSHTAFQTDIREFGRSLLSEFHALRGSGAGAIDNGREDDSDADRFQNTRIEQLTSTQTVQKNADTFRRLSKRADDTDSIDAVLATNMVSVGIDVSRLALMVVNGQPLTTAEYIQATSRVGRADVPGLVVANYYRHQARSLSHYENFRAYHQSFYRFVEPGSVTPYTYQVRSRALHAALVTAVRYTCEALRDNKSAAAFHKNDDEVRAVIQQFTLRCQSAAEDDYAAEVALHVQRLAGEWHEEARRAEREKFDLHYTSSPHERNAELLLYDRDEVRGGLWPTLQSMRNVESEGVLKVYD